MTHNFLKDEFKWLIITTMTFPFLSLMWLPVYDDFTNHIQIIIIIFPTVPEGSITHTGPPVRQRTHLTKTNIQ